MKRTLLVSAMIICVSCAFGQTVNQLLEKYKGMAGALYQETPKDSLFMNIQTDEEFISQGLNKKEIAFIKKNLKQVEQVTLELDSTQRKELDKDIKALKGYALLFVVNDNNTPEDGGNIVKQMWNNVMNPKSLLSVYGKTKKNMVDDVLLCWDIWNKVVLGHVDCKIKKETLAKAFTESDGLISFEQENNVVDMKDVLEDVNKGNVLIVIEGKEYPDLQSEKEGTEYMKANGIRWNTESWIVGEAVKEKYPNTDKKVVIEFAEKAKEQK